LVSELQKQKGFKGVIAATRKTTPGKKNNEIPQKKKHEDD
jgi:nicotinate-nucleotide pyrophosphorylase